MMACQHFGWHPQFNFHQVDDIENIRPGINIQPI